MDSSDRTFLRTLGHPVLRRRDGSVVDGLRRKDLALLAYLCVEGDRPFSRAHLAALLWGESPEERARHSLTQALRRAGAGVGPGALAMERDTVRWTGTAVCDAELLLEADPRLDELLTIYEGPFLEGFEAGFGSEEFSAWADARRAELRRAAVRLLDRAGEKAEREGDWARAQRIGERTVQVDREWEGGHRRVMRALLERGERNLALRHFREFAAWLTYEIGGRPDPETMALADQIRAAAEFPILRETPARDPGIEVPAASSVAPGDAGSSRGPGDAAAYDGLEDDDGDAGDEAITAVVPIDADRAEDHPASPLLDPPDEIAAPADVPPSIDRPGMRRVRRLWLYAAAVLLAIAILVAGVWALRRWLGDRDEVPAGRAEVIRAKGDTTAYLVFGDVLYAFPDRLTQQRCTGGWPRVRRVRTLPGWPRRVLPSARTTPWLGRGGAVIADDPAPRTQYVSVGCVLSPVPDTLTFRAIFGHTDWSLSARAPESLLRHLPRIAMADPFPVRAPGTLIQGAGDSIRWVAYHGGALAVRSAAVLATYCRTRAEVVRVTDGEFRYYQSRADLPPASEACRRQQPRKAPASSRR